MNKSNVCLLLFEKRFLLFFFLQNAIQHVARMMNVKFFAISIMLQNVVECIALI